MTETDFRTLKFKNAVESDLEMICKLPENKEVLFYMYPKGRFPLNKTQMIELFHKRFEHTVFYINDEIVGYANIYFTQNEVEPHIGNVILHKDYRGKGYGKFMVQTMIGKAFKLSLNHKIKIGVFETNPNVYKLYKNFGFKEVAYEYRRDYNGRNIKLILMESVQNKE
jgi:predicted GNAT family N-acyltransferase